MANAAALVLCASPRQGGNCDAASAVAARTLAEAGPAAEILNLREHTVLPCESCGHCARHFGADCPRQALDDSGPLLAALASARTRQAEPPLLLVSPVYFYHLPAQFKALIDRSQPFWSALEAESAAAANRASTANGATSEASRRKAGAVLIAARSKGQKIFEGSIVTLRFWLGLFGLELVPPLTLYGLDGHDAFRSDPANAKAVADYVRGLQQRPSHGPDAGCGRCDRREPSVGCEPDPAS